MRKRKGGGGFRGQKRTDVKSQRRGYQHKMEGGREKNALQEGIQELLLNADPERGEEVDFVVVGFGFGLGFLKIDTSGLAKGGGR